ncbi:MAG: tRNA uridine-5-carboxymethylaminomethyl(34) synthesis enzyme MnmG, partial [Planctomycetia bacterium]|nr:tRNA uridine-5-carboxymethylaminomethyl(34) synthesis enzyme MnmG [Planctomycetia bacterium]
THRMADGTTLATMLRRPEFGWPEAIERLGELEATSQDVARQVTYDIKYAGYVERQHIEVARQRRLSEKTIPVDFDYATVGSMRNEARQKLSHIRPITLAQAGRISGITPADIALLLVHLERGGPRQPTA